MLISEGALSGAFPILLSLPDCDNHHLGSWVFFLLSEVISLETEPVPVFCDTLAGEGDLQQPAQ